MTPEFRQALRSLPPAVQRAAQRAYSIWCQQPTYPGLHWQPIQSVSCLWSVRITNGIGHYRALAYKSYSARGEQWTWIWIGKHSTYDLLIKRLESGNLSKMSAALRSAR